jgi:FkbM family methyltransferase
MGEIRDVTIDIGGEDFQITSDDDYLKHIENGFEPEMVSLFRTVAEGSDVIVDAGANIGCSAILFGQLAKEVYAYEPSASTFSFLSRNVTRSGRKNIYLRNIGLGAASGESTLTFSPTNRSGGFVSNQTQASTGHTVESIVIRALDDELKLPGERSLDFLKIDVEGFEANVIRGASRSLTQYKPVVILELNHWCLNAFQRTSIPDFFDFLRAQFPVLLAVDGSTYMNLHDPNQSYAVMYQHILRMRYLNVLAAFDESRLGTFRQRYKNEAVRG